MSQQPAAYPVRRLTSFFSDRKIATKIAIGFVCILAITASISAIAYTSFVQVGHGFETFNQRVVVVGLARDVDRSFLAFRRVVREFAATGSLDDLKAAEAERVVLKDFIAKALAEIKNPERLAKMKHIAEEFEIYSKDFDKSAVLRKELDKLMHDVLDPTGLLLLTEIEQLQTLAVTKGGNSNASILAGEAVKQLMLARLNVNKFLSRHEEAAGKGADQAFANLKAAMTAFGAAATNDDIRKLFAQVDANVNKYADAYKKAAYDAHEIDKLINGEMRKLAQAIAADAEAVKQSGIAEEKKIELETAASIAAAESLVLILAAGGVLLGALLSFFIGRGISKPIVGLVSPIEDLASGNFAVTVPGTGRKDEVGQIAEAVRSMAEKVRSTIAEVKSSAREVTNASVEISSATTDLSQRTEEQAASLEETSASMEQISATVRKNAENAQQANTSAAQTREVADRGGEVVAKAVGAMAKIEDSSRKISDIIGVIDEIARQTNLLALNAAVEAARAGEAGRGFAVVASEVRSLAQRSSQAAKDIKDLITNSNSQVKDGVELVNQAGAALNEIVESIKQVAAIVSDIANASMEQSTGIEQVNKALTQMDEVTQQNSALVEENAATAKTLEHQAKSMDDQVAFFRIDTAAGAEGMTHARVVAAKSVVNKFEARPVAVSELKTAPKRAAGGARGMQTQLATAIKHETEWKEF